MRFKKEYDAILYENAILDPRIKTLCKNESNFYTLLRRGYLKQGLADVCGRVMPIIERESYFKLVEAVQDIVYITGKRGFPNHKHLTAYYKDKESFKQTILERCKT